MDAGVVGLIRIDGADWAAEEMRQAVRQIS